MSQPLEIKWLTYIETSQNGSVENNEGKIVVRNTEH